jgi:glycosyltransferase involved in cell wall biosynthesis
MPLARIYARGNAGGLMRDMALVAAVLEADGFEVEGVALGKEKGLRILKVAGLRAARAWTRPVDVQVFLEHVVPGAHALSRCNLLVPNPEWFRPEYHPHLPAFRALLCKTRHAGAIFGALGARTRHVGFSSDDRMDATVARERSVFHLAGRSPVKGTEAVFAAWARHPEWPRLTVVQAPRHARPHPPAANIEHLVGRIDDAALRTLQNRSRFHLHPSEAEGFGHCLVEGMSVGALGITTAGEPMDELLDPAFGVLVPPARVEGLGLARRFFVDVEGIEAGMAAALALDAARVEAMGAAARAAFEARDAAFRGAFADAVREAMHG